MKLPAFAYHRAESLADAVSVLAEHGDRARVAEFQERLKFAEHHGVRRYGDREEAG